MRDEGEEEEEEEKERRQNPAKTPKLTSDFLLLKTS